MSTVRPPPVPPAYSPLTGITGGPCIDPDVGAESDAAVDVVAAVVVVVLVGTAVLVSEVATVMTSPVGGAAARLTGAGTCSPAVGRTVLPGVAVVGPPIASPPVGAVRKFRWLSCGGAA